MEEGKWSYIMVSVVFYLCYFFYFLTYSYEIIFLFQTKIDYIVFCLLLITSLFSIYFCSKGLKYICTFLIAIISFIEIYEYTNNSPKNLYDEEFLKLFLLVRLFSAVNLVVFLHLHIKNLKIIKNDKLNNDKLNNDKLNIDKASTVQSVAVSKNTHPEKNKNYYHNNNNNNNPCNNYYNNQDNFLKSNTVTSTHNNLFKQDIPQIHQQTGVITSKTLPPENIYVLKHVSIPIIEKEIINKQTNLQNVYEMQTNDSFNHYKINHSCSKNNINENKTTEHIQTHNTNQNNNPYMNHIIQNNQVPNYTYEHPTVLQYYTPNFQTHNMGSNIQ
ncbi:conserved Plasmodium protein, unknown function [Plasmodium sp. DRC-Itaito]|nr:conserved Plasmodium protein, unknown function [Plasmodium sp. DRC-Itaito]